MKITLIGPAYPFRGGIVHYSTLLYQSLRKRHSVTFFSFLRQYPKILFPGKSDRDPSNLALKEDGIVPTLDSINPITWITTAKKVVQFDPDLVILPWWVFFWTPQFYSICKYIKAFSKAKILFICHNVVEHESSWIKATCSKLVLRQGDFFIVHSSEDEKNLRAMIKDAQVKRTFHPSYEVFNSVLIDKKQARDYCKISENKKVLLFFGFVRPYKGLKYLVEAFFEAKSKLNDLRLLIVGEFWEGKQEIIDWIDKNGIKGDIDLVDRYVPNEEIPFWFGAADVVVLPYISGTGSGIVQIAYGFDKPVIGTTVGCLPEVISPEKTGILVPPQDSKALSEAIVRFFETHLGQTLIPHIQKEKQKFSWEAMAEVIEAFFRK